MGWRPDLIARVPVNSGRTENEFSEFAGTKSHEGRRTYHSYALENGISDHRRKESEKDVLMEECANDHSMSTRAT